MMARGEMYRGPRPAVRYMRAGAHWEEFLSGYSRVFQVQRPATKGDSPAMTKMLMSTEMKRPMPVSIFTYVRARSCVTFDSLDLGKGQCRGRGWGNLAGGPLHPILSPLAAQQNMRAVHPAWSGNHIPAGVPCSPCNHEGGVEVEVVRHDGCPHRARNILDGAIRDQRDRNTWQGNKGGRLVFGVAGT